MVSSQPLVISLMYGKLGNNGALVVIEKLSLLCYNCSTNLEKRRYIMKRLTKSNNRMLLGVCAGIAEYFDIDPNVVRVLWVLFCLAGGSGILGYIIAAVIMPSAYEE